MRKTLIRPLLGAVAVAAALTACTPLGTTGPMSGPYSKTIWGPDVSNYQHPKGVAINWTLVRRSGARFAFVKVNEGSTYVNPWEATDIRAARAAGLVVAGYHFARPRLPLTTAAADARAFSTLLGNVRTRGYLPPVLDLEETGGLPKAQVVAWAHSFLSTLQAVSGRVPMLYTGGWFWRGYLGNPSGFRQYPVWIGQYTPTSIGPNLFGDYTYSTFWQYTDAAKVPGIPGSVDASWFHGSLSQLSSMAWIFSSTNLATTATTTGVTPLLQRMSVAAAPASTAVSTTVSTAASTAPGSLMAENPGSLGAK